MIRKSSILLTVAAASLLTVTACSSDGSEAAPTSLEITRPSPTMDGGVCPEKDPPADTRPQWQLDGATGSLAVAGPTDDAGPLINVTAPLTVNATQVKTLTPGTGQEVTDDSAVNVCYEGVNGRDGEVFDSAFQRGTPTRLRPDRVVPGFRQALLGQRVGASVAVVMTPADGYPTGTPDGTIREGDSIVFVLKIMAAERDDPSNG